MASEVRLVVCINQRLGTQRCCVGSGNLDYSDQIEALIEQAGLAVSIVKRECLGKCEQGPVMRIAPGGRFFTEINENSLPMIMDEIKAFLASRCEPTTVDGGS
ncbi:MAG: (2Fe-2S) ferredoxin [Gammaproteobacteria bacterium]